jgi:hypothetical protein
MLTLDQNIAAQQNPRNLVFPIVICRLSRAGQELEQLIKFVPDIVQLLAADPPPGFHFVGRTE